MHWWRLFIESDKKSHHAPTNVPRLPRSDIPPDHKCPYENCGYKARNERAYQQHMVMRHGIYYEQAATSLVALKEKHGSSRADLERLETLAPWHCVALARHVVYGQPLSEVAKEMKHNKDSLRAVARSPAGVSFIAKMEQELSDPVKLVKDMMKSDTMEMHFMWLQARDWAFAAKDYQAIHRMAKEVGLQPVLDDAAGKVGPTKISLHLNMQDLAAPVASSSFKVLDAEIEFEEDADGGRASSEGS